MSEGETVTSSLPPAVDRLVEAAVARGSDGIEGLLKHKLGPLAALWFTRRGIAVPPELQGERRSASLSMLIAPALVQKVREASDLPIVLLKGPEVAALYPPGGRRFEDIDILSDSAPELQRSLLDAGFAEVRHEEYLRLKRPHHLHPLRHHTIALDVEVHAAPSWPMSAPKGAPLEELLDAAVPSVLGVDGVFAPAREHHALLLAAHAWRHEPLQRLSDLLDIAVVSSEVPRSELRATADRWGIGRLWATTTAAIDAIFGDGPRTIPLRVWAPHLKEVRGRTVLENHLQRWLHPYWELPPLAALAENLRVARRDLTPREDETWHDKLRRTVSALRHPSAVAAERPGGSPVPSQQRSDVHE
jgi:hypothetical protein